MSLRRGLINGIIISLIFWLLLGSCGYIGYKWAVKDARKSASIHEVLGG